MLLMAICIVATVSSCKRKPDDPPINLQGDVQTLPYTQNFDKSFGTYITYNVAGDEVWTIDLRLPRCQDMMARIIWRMKTGLFHHL